MATSSRSGKQVGDSGSAKFVVITNLGADTQIVVPDDSRVGKEIILQPWESVSLMAAEYAELWAEDANLASVVGNGLVKVEHTNLRPKPFPREPVSGKSSAVVTDPLERVVVEQIVRGTDEQAEFWIGLRLQRDMVDSYIGWMGNGFRDLLKAALAWLKTWGPPEPLVWRVEAINERLAKLEIPSKEEVTDK